jgi:hypothetical protein
MWPWYFVGVANRYGERKVMGSLHAQEFADMASDGTISIEQSISYHLTSNHFPPVPVSMVSVCIEAIEAVNEGDIHRKINLPAQVFWRGEAQAPAWSIVEGHHLDAWINSDED